MPDPQLSTQPADPIHTKLLEFDLDLAAQAAELMAQLEPIQAKRQGLKTLMKLFSPANPSSQADPTPGQKTESGSASQDPDSEAIYPLPFNCPFSLIHSCASSCD